MELWLQVCSWDSSMLAKRLQGCSILLLVFALSSASGGVLEASLRTAAAAIMPEPAAASLGGGGRRSLATGGGMFCVAMPNADPTALQAGLNWACGAGRADCTAIQPGGACYKPNNLVQLASYAYNDYFHRSSGNGATCSFNGTAMTTPNDPSSGQCVFAGSSMAGGSTPAASAPTGLGPPSSFTPGFGNGSTFGSPTSILNPLDGADGALAGARRALCLLLLLLPPPLLFFL